MGTVLEVGLSNAVLAGLLALVAAVVSRVARRPALAHSLWLLVLLKLVTPPLLRVPLPWLPTESSTVAASPSAKEEIAVRPGGPEPAETDSRTRQEPLAPGNPANPAVIWFLVPVDLMPDTARPESSAVSTRAGPDHWAGWTSSSGLQVAAWLWLGTSFLWFAWTAFAIYRFQRLLRFATPAPPALQKEVQRLGARLGLTRTPGLWLIPGAVSPMLWPVGRSPRLLFPARLLEQLDREQRASLFAHELAHYRRRDHWVRLAEAVVLGLYWWHPVAWWARNALREAEEQCCDAWVVWALAGADRSYATALLQTVAFLSRARCALPAAASGIGQVRHLRRRLTMIMQRQTPRSLSWTGVLVVLALGLLLLPVLPILAQPQGDYKRDPGGKQTDTDQKIAELKKQIQALEEQKPADKKGAVEKKRQAEEIQKVRDEVGILTKEMNNKRRELQDVEKRHAEAVARLAKMEGKNFTGFYEPVTKDGKTFYQYVPSAKGNETNATWYQAVPYVEGKGNATWYQAVPYISGGKIEVDFDKGATKAYMVPFISSDKAAADSDYKLWTKEDLEKAKKAKAEAAGKRSSELEEKLDRLAKELEAIRRELRQNRGGEKR
jgi:beta-lactamase regulating signal transducer with metallopeptidase domain